MEEKIFNAIKEKVKDKGIEVSYDTVIEGILDSITFVELVVELETDFDFEFEDEMLSTSKFETVAKLVEYVKKQSEEQ